MLPTYKITIDIVEQRYDEKQSNVATLIIGLTFLTYDEGTTLYAKGFK